MKINKLLAAVVIAAFALPVMAQSAPAAAPAPAAPMAAPADAPAAAAPAKTMHKKHHRSSKKHAIKAVPVNKGA